MTGEDLLDHGQAEAAGSPDHPDANQLTLHRESPIDVDPTGVVVDQIWYPSKDGTEISMFLIHREGAPTDGSLPYLLNGYGGFDIPSPRASTQPMPCGSRRVAGSAARWADVDHRQQQPLLLNVEAETGHGFGVTIDRRADQAARQQAFMMEEVGMQAPAS